MNKPDENITVVVTVKKGGVPVMTAERGLWYTWEHNLPHGQHIPVGQNKVMAGFTFEPMIFVTDGGK